MDGYAAQQREFDWLCEPAVMTRALRQLRVGCDAGLAVDVGCGTSSSMAAALRDDLGARAVLCLDKDAAAVEFLRREGVTAHRCDIGDPDAGVVAPGSVDLVVDKSALDCILCSDDVGRYLRGVHAMLRPDGSYAIASFRTEDELRRIFGNAWRWDRCVSLTARCRLVVLAKGPGGDVLAQPVVTPDATPRDRFPLAVADAYEEMFSAEERKWYSLTDFRGDLAAVFPGAETLSAADAALFMRRMG